MLRFGRWGFSLDQWLEGLGSPSLQGDAASPVPFLKLLFASDSILPADTIASQPAHDDSASVTPLGTAAEPLAADPPIWLLPETASASAPIFPLGANDSEESSATASFVTPSGDHFAFLSSEPAFGLGGGLFVNTDTRTILTEAEAGRIGLGSGGDDQLVLGGGNGDSNLLANGGNGLLSHGSESGAMSLAGFGAMFERIVLLDGSDYNLAAVDGNVGAGRTLTVSALALGAGNHLSFDGSAETAGRFVLEGGAGDDSLIGGHGADNLYGGAGADSLAGGAGADRFVYMSAAESTGAHYDTILDFTFGEDVIDLPVTVPGLDAAVTTGALSQDSFDADLAAALGGSALEAGHALFFTPDSGALAGQTFLVVDANGEAGYQAGVDFVIHFATQPPAGLHDASFLA